MAGSTVAQIFPIAGIPEKGFETVLEIEGQSTTLKTEIAELWNATREVAIDALQKLIALCQSVWAWLESATAETLDWLSTLLEKAQQGEITTPLVLIALALLAALLWSIAPAVARKAGKAPGFMPATNRTAHFGRWTVRGYQSPAAAAKRRARWKQNVMTPAEQLAYVKKAQELKGVFSAKRKHKSVLATVLKRLIVSHVVIAGALLLATNYEPHKPETAGRTAAHTDSPKPEPPERIAAQTVKPVQKKPPAKAKEKVVPLPELVVMKVKDGDSLIARNNQVAIEVRLHGIDAPEYKQPHGKRAKRALEKLVARETISLQIIDVDKYGRAVAIAFHDGKNINLDMVCSGHAWWYDRYAPDNRELKRCQSQAKSMAIGLWKTERAIPPWEWRRKNRR